MKNYKKYLFLIAFNIILSMLIVCISPRFDMITLFYFIFLNIFIFAFLFLFERNKNMKINDQIDEIINLIHSLNPNKEVYKKNDGEFGKLKDEITKIILENKNIIENSNEKQKVLRDYSEDLAHQIKTPLTGILLMLDLIEEDKENIDEYILLIRNNINRLENLTDILLKLASLDSDITKFNLEYVNVLELIKSVKEDLDSYFGLKNYEVKIFGDDFILNCDKKWTHEAILNICKNAIEASPENNIEIILRESNVFKSILVKDFSPGMSKDTLKKAMQRFYKSDPNSQGYGIGLPMAKTILNKENGDLIYNREKKYNTFEMRFYK